MNASIMKSPSDVNKFPYARAGLIQIEPNDISESDELMQFSSYVEHTRELERYETWSRELRLT